MNCAIVLSGGTGSRTGADMPKQYFRAGGYMMVTHALKPILTSKHIDKVIIICADEWKEEILKDLKDAGIDAAKIAGFTVPGDTRQLSVINGLTYIKEELGGADTVLVHDGVRPYIKTDLIDRCYEALSEEGADGVMPVIPMKDTVYLSNDGKGVSGLIDRNTLYAGQAPELFRFEAYLAANTDLLPERIYKINGASEPAVISGMKIKMVPGDEENVKITTAGDLKKFTENLSFGGGK